MSTGHKLSLFLLATGTSILPAIAHAQSTAAPAPVINNTIATQTAVPSLVNQPAGDIALFVEGNASLTYDDNVQRRRVKNDDWAAMLSAAIGARGDFGSARASLRAEVDQSEYFQNGDENTTDWSIGGQIADKFDAGSGYFSAGFSQSHEDRGDPNASVTDRKRTVYNLAEVGAGGVLKGAGVKFGADVSFRHYDFSDNRQLNNSVMNNDDRDRDQFGVSGKAAVELSPGYSLFGRVAYHTVNYSSARDDFGFNRDSHDLTVGGGVDFEVTDTLTGDIYAGYITHGYDDPRFANVNTVGFGGNLNWTAGPATTISLAADRSVQETVDPRYRGYLTSSVSLSVNQTISTAVSLSGGIGYGHDDYRKATATVTTNRADDNLNASIGLSYSPVKAVSVGLSYAWSKRVSSATFPGDEYSDNTLSATLGIHF
ncbi:hypothetical protein BH09PSE4_BH09PSE4_05740 [soil metagenome]